MADVSPGTFPQYSTSNYLLRHWRGELSLAVSYWVNNVLATGLSGAMIAIVSRMDRNGFSLRQIAVASVITLSLSVCLWIWSAVGTWRSAGKHVARGGTQGWATLARFMIAMGVLSAISKIFVSIGPQFEEFGLIALGRDPIGKFDIRTSSDGQALLFSGTFREGAADAVGKTLDAAPAMTRVVLNSNGGRLLEAQKVAELIRARKLNTYVEYQCVSACTIAFLAGKDRSATPNAKIGFHQASFVGVSAGELGPLTQRVVEVYRAASLPEPFIKKIEQTPSTSMWYPTRDELISANVVTRVSLGGEVATMGVKSKQELVLALKSAPLPQAYEKRFPGIIEEAAANGWAVKAKGGADNEVETAMRATFDKAIPAVLKSANDEVLARFSVLIVEELEAARTVSVQACRQFLNSNLDISKTLPKKIGDDDTNFMIAALNAPPRPARASEDTGALRIIGSTLTAAQIEAIGHPKSPQADPGMVCDAFTSMYKSINTSPDRIRKEALREMFQDKK